MRHPHRAGALAVCALLAACSSATKAPSLPAGATPVAGGCGTTPLYKGTSFSWTASAAGPAALVQATSHRADAVAYLFGYPLRAGHPRDPDNKILWVVRLPRNGSELALTGHPLGASTPRVDLSWPANSSPGEIYPSIDDVPSAGCWAFTLAWAGHHDSIELRYSP